jgi:hypothetical protein
MMYGEVYVSERTMHARLQERRHDLEARRLVRQERSHAHTSLAVRHRSPLGQMSHLLVAMGAWQVAHGLPPYPRWKKA